MKRAALLLILAISMHGFSQDPPKPQFTIKNATDLVGKRVTIIDRLPLCKPATYNADINRGGQQANVVAAKPQNLPKMSARDLARLPSRTRDLMLEQYTAAALTLQLDDGIKLDTCGVPYSAKKLSEYLELASGEAIVVADTEPGSPQATAAKSPSGELDDAEVKAALSGIGRDDQVTITDMGLMAAQGAQVPSVTLFRPEAILAERQETAKKQFLTYSPTQDDRERAITVLAHGYVGATVGEGCQSITRVVLLSDPEGQVVKEAYSAFPVTGTWGNAYGATTQCDALQAKFSYVDVKAVRAAAKDGEFYVAIFSGSTRTKTYKVKHKHQSKLNLDQILSASKN